MRDVDLRVSYRNGRPRVGCLYLSDPNDKSARCRRISPEMVVDIDKNGRLIGIELLDPPRVTLVAITNVLERYGLEPFKESDLTPILAV